MEDRVKRMSAEILVPLPSTELFACSVFGG